MTARKEWAMLIFIYGLPGIVLSVVNEVSLNMVGARLLFLSFLGFIGFGITLAWGNRSPTLGVMFWAAMAQWFNELNSGFKKLIHRGFRERFSLKAFIATERELDRLDWKDILRTSTFLPSALLLTAALYFNWLNENLGFYVFLCPLLWLYFVGENAVKWWAFIALALAITLHGYSAHHDFNSPGYLLFKQWCVFHVIRYRWWYAVPGIVFFIGVQRFWFPDGRAYGHLMEEMNMFLINWTIALFVMRYRYGYVYMIFIFMLILDSSLPGIFTPDTTVTRFEIFLTSLPYIIPPVLLWCKKEISHYYKFIIIIAIVASSLQG
jgi:hypothetical protein